MRKEAIGNIELPTVGRMALGGALTGGSAMALLNLLRKAREMNDERKDRTKVPETDANTIVLRLPHVKAAESCDPCDDKSKSPKVETTKTVTTEGTGGQYRRALDGTFGTKTAAGWPTLTASALAGMGGIGVGAHLVNRVYERRRIKSLKQELEAAQQHYMDSLVQGKTAEYVEELFPVSLEKSAQSRNFGLLDYPLAAMAIMSILGTGGTAYITKKLLDERFDDATKRERDIPQAKRIVFQSQPQPQAPKPMEPNPEEDEKRSGYEPGTQEDIDCVEAALGVMTDKLDTRTRVLEDAKVKSAMVKAGTSARRLFKLANNADELIAYMRGSPELRRMIQDAYIANHPTYSRFKALANIPGARRIMDRKLYGAIGDWASGNTEVKEARMSLPGMLASSVIGSRIGGERSADPEAIAQAVVRANNEAANEEEQPEETPPIELQGADEGAQSYLAANHAQILKVLQEMRAEGKI